MDWIVNFIFLSIIISYHGVFAIVIINGIQGTTITLECPLTSPVESNMIWRGPYGGSTIYYHSRDVNTNLPEDLYSRMFVVGKFNLRIVNVQLSDEGLYDCSIANDSVTTQNVTFSLSLPALLSSESPDYYRHLLIDRMSNKLIVGHMNSMTFINISDTVQVPVSKGTFTFNPETADKTYCMYQKPEKPYCQNHIKFITRKTDDTLLLCGTNAYSPRGYEFNVTSNSFVGLGNVPCAAGPFDNFTGIYVPPISSNSRGFMYYGSTSSNGDSTVSRPIYGTDGSISEYMKGVISSKWMKDPQFVASFDVQDKVLIFFRETAVDTDPTEYKVYSRVAKVCKEDVGGESMLRNRWTTYQKARLNCSIPGADPIYFDVIQDVVTSDNKVFYGLFTSGDGSPASAICAFSMSNIDNVLNGAFKTQINPSYFWTEATNVPSPRPGQCTSDSKLVPNTVLTFISDNPIMYLPVQHLYGKPLLVLDDIEFQQLELHDNLSDVVLYAASNLGKVYKLFVKNDSAYVSNIESPLTKPEIIWSMKQQGDFLYIGTDTSVRQINVVNCEKYRWIDSCIKDPHCAWINDTNLLEANTETQCFNRCRSLTSLIEKRFLNIVGVYTHNNYMISSTTPYWCPPGKPKHMRVTLVQNDRLHLSWESGFNGPYIQKFVLEYCLAESTDWNVIHINMSGTEFDPQTRELTGLLEASLYQLRIYATNLFGTSAKSNVILASTRTGLPTNKSKDDSINKIWLLFEIVTALLVAAIVILTVMLFLTCRRLLAIGAKNTQCNGAYHRANEITPKAEDTINYANSRFEGTTNGAFDPPNSPKSHDTFNYESLAIDGTTNGTLYHPNEITSKNQAPYNTLHNDQRSIQNARTMEKKEKENGTVQKAMNDSQGITNGAFHHPNEVPPKNQAVDMTNHNDQNGLQKTGKKKKKEKENYTDQKTIDEMQQDSNNKKSKKKKKKKSKNQDVEHAQDTTQEHHF